MIDDASPNADLRDWLDLQAAARQNRAASQQRNLGFAASVNRALALCPAGDVLLLNADALPPPGSLERLAEVAHPAPDIGTVTPLSNNGEFTSLPKPYVANPLGDAKAEIARLDASGAPGQRRRISLICPMESASACYITRACLDAVGPLPELYARGYYEDVEFCLRAREKGFRNVCASGVYVGHAGARSFGAEKRRLVMRNLAMLEAAVSRLRLECGAFVARRPAAAPRAARSRLCFAGRSAARWSARGGVTPSGGRARRGVGEGGRPVAADLRCANGRAVFARRRGRVAAIADFRSTGAKADESSSPCCAQAKFRGSNSSIPWR